jgi:glycerophosphoryl diester phosphodiesterase
MNILLDLKARPVIAHRGNRAHAPENTLESFAQAVAEGADAIELDVRISADGVPVVMHDPNIQRTTSGSGDVADMTYSDLSAFDAGARFTTDGKSFPYRDKGHRIPSFDEVLEAFPDTPTLIEIKTADAAVAVRRSIEAHRAEERTVVDSMDGLALQVFADSKIPVGASRNDVIRVMTEVLLHLPLTPFAFRALCVPPSHRGIPVPLRRFAKVAPSQNCVVHVWTINDPAVATALWLDGIHGIITDDPAAMLRARMLLPR